MQSNSVFESDSFSGKWLFFKTTLIFTALISLFGFFSGLGLAFGILPHNQFKIPSIILITGAIVLTFFLNRIRQYSFPVTPGLSYILGVVFAFPVMVINLYFHRHTAFGPLFQNYLIYSSLFVIYLNFKAKNIFPKSDNNDSGLLKGIGGNLARLLSWLAFAVFLSSFFTADLFILNMSNEKATNFVMTVLPVIRIAMPIVLILTLIGLIKRFKSLILLGNIIHLCSAGYVASRIYRINPDSSFLDFAGPSFIANLIVIGVLFLCLIPDWNTKKKPDSELSENLAPQPKDFSLKWYEPAIILALIIATSLTLNPLINKNDRFLESIETHNFVHARKILAENSQLQNQATFNLLIRKPDLESFKILLGKKETNKFKVNESGYLNNLFNENELESLKYLIAQGIDFSHVEIIRSASFSGEPRDLDKKFSLLDILLQERSKRNKPISEFYNFKNTPETSFRKFLNPLAIAIMKGNFEIANYLWKKGFRIDDEVVAASISFGKINLNPLAPQLKIINEPELETPISFFLVDSSLNDKELSFFLNLGIKLGQENEEGQNLFHAFALRKNLTGKEILLKQAKFEGVSVDKVDKNGNTPLWTAAQNNNIKAFSTLIKLGADTTCKNRKGENLKDYCTKNQFNTLLAYLEE